MIDALRKAKVVFVVIGFGLAALGILGFIFDWGSSSSTVAASPGSSSLSSSSPSSSAASSSSSVPSVRETPEDYFAAFTTAIRSSDAAFLVDRMHPEVIKRYGAAQCEQFVSQLFDPTVDLHIVKVDGPETYDYASDGKSALVPDTYVFHLDGTAAGTVGPREYHLALVNGRYRLFVDCGNPI